ARRTERDGKRGAVAECLRVGDRVVGALSIGGEAGRLDPVQLPLFAHCASLALARRPATAATSVTEVLDAVAGVATDLEGASVLVRVFDAAERLFGATAGFCAVFEGSAVRIPHFRGLDRFGLINGAAAELFSLAAACEIGQPVAGKLGHPVLEELLIERDQGSTTEVVIGEAEPRVYKASARRVMSSGGRVLGRVLVLDD